ncbi:2-dehydropantoate 2-reductase (Ketopantoate reductase) (KPA reductase) (KPR) [Taxawa tesnikishii (nom. ined.)]|nr:2-dehydropantoate 2-reductase (Ketopantoate reductase) (KPA reductase) (KPR) [Dothideales sp. JES 119]
MSNRPTLAQIIRFGAQCLSADPANAALWTNGTVRKSDCCSAKNTHPRHGQRRQAGRAQFEGIAKPPPISLIFHRYKLLEVWEKSNKEITLETDGFKVARSGFDVELAVPKSREHGVEVREGMLEPEAVNMRPHEVAQQLREDAAGDMETFKPDEGSLPGDYAESDELIHNLIVTVKAGFTISALSAVRHRLTPESTVCFLQNGMGIIDDVNAALFPDPATRPHYIQGIVSHGVNSPPGNDPFSLSTPATEPSRLESYREKRHIKQPLLPWRVRTMTPPRVRKRAIGLPPNELLQQQLEKLAVNSIINPLTVLLDSRNGSILYNYALTRTLRLLLAETSLVLRSLPELKALPNTSQRFSPERLETLVVSVAYKTRDNISSTLADVRAGRMTEIKWINGYIVRRGEELGIQCVCNYMMMQTVLGKYAMIKRELLDEVPTGVEDLTGEGFKTE